MSRLITCGLLICSAFVSVAGAEEGFTKISHEDSFEGWKAVENPGTWTIKDGAYVCKGDRSHLFYVGDDKPLKNFELKADVMTKPGSNAGIYFHTKLQESGWPKFGYEAQVNNTHKDPKKTASLYGVKNVSEAPAKDNEWFTMHIKVVGRHITIAVDGKTQVDFTEPEGQKAFSDSFERRLGSGTIALQGHDPKSEVHFKNIRIKRLAD